MRTKAAYKGFFWVEAWSPYLEKWTSTTGHFSLRAARADAENRADTYRRAYRVTDESRAEHGRFTGEG